VPSGATSVWSPSHAALVFGTHAWLALHVNFSAQSASVAHFVPHTSPAHWYGVQLVVATSGHRPVPVQVAARVATPAVQDALRHAVSGPTKPAHEVGITPSHSEAPQTPVVEAAQAARPACGGPRSGMQLPGASVESQDSHWPLHGLLQQTPSAQKVPTGQAAAGAQGAPRPTRDVHVPALQ
jgi:hypothetical protein